MALVAASPLAAQQGDLRSSEVPDSAARWNAPRVLELVARARRAREEIAQAGDLRSYRAEVEGHVYFFLDPDTGERPLIRIDQVAVDVRWQAPDRFQQHILGHRSEVRLPVRDFAYYPDRLTLVRHGFGDEIRIGSGRDVSGVPHPFAVREPGAGRAEPYDFRLADSLSLSIPQRPEPLRIYEVEIRPRDPAAPGILGSIFLDRASASVVRMDFTFTPASYTDSRNDRVSVYLNYGLWEDRYWLPNEQRIEVRREIPRLDIGVGTVIRSVLRVRDYHLNAPVPGDLGSIPAVTSVAEETRESFPFEEGLYAGLERDGLGDLQVGVDPAELRARAFERLEAAPASGLSPVRFHLPDVSSAVRFDRVQGLRMGMGATLRPGSASVVRVRGAFPLADGRPQAGVGVEARIAPNWTTSLELGLRDLSDLGLSPGSAPLVSSLAAVARGEDYRDPYWVDFGHVRLERTIGEESRFSFGFGVERHRSALRAVGSAPLDADRGFRPVRPIRNGEFFSAEAGWWTSFEVPFSGNASAELRAKTLHGQPGGGLSLEAELDGVWASVSRTRELNLTGRAWSWIGDALPQGHRLLGGRGTVPGFPYRAFAGDQVAHLSLTASTDLVGPLVRMRGGLHTGWSGGTHPEVAEAWGTRDTEGVLVSVSAGLGIGWDLLRVNVARGVDGGEWQLLFSIDPGWWELL